MNASIRSDFRFSRRSVFTNQRSVPHASPAGGGVGAGELAEMVSDQVWASAARTFTAERGLVDSVSPVQL